MNTHSVDGYSKALVTHTILIGGINQGLDNTLLTHVFKMILSLACPFPQVIDSIQEYEESKSFIAKLQGGTYMSSWASTSSSNLSTLDSAKVRFEQVDIVWLSPEFIEGESDCDQPSPNHYMGLYRGLCWVTIKGAQRPCAQGGVWRPAGAGRGG